MYLAPILLYHVVINMYFLRISQFLTWPIAYVYFHLIYRLRIYGSENLRKVSRPFIIIVNHVSFVDSFLFRLILGFRTPYLPLRFMAVNRFNWKRLNFLATIGVIDFIYGLFGAFIVVPGLGMEKNLEEAKRLISHKENIVIYPEGKIVIGHEIAPFHSGATVLASETGAPILPVALHLGGWHFLRRGLSVNIGEPVIVPRDASIDEETESLHETITGLFQNS